MSDELMAIGRKLLEYDEAGDAKAGLAALYAPDAVSVEANTMQGKDSAEVVGVEAISAKHDWWESTMEVHSASSDGPYPHMPNQFAVIYEFDATDKESGNRVQMKEVGIYTVENGKIVREQFFYPAPG